MAKPLGSSKTGGRKKGTPNKRTLDFAEALQESGLDPLKEITRILSGEDLPPQERIRFLMELLPYIYPKRKAVEVTDSSPNDQDVIYLTSWGSK